MISLERHYTKYSTSIYWNTRDKKMLRRSTIYINLRYSLQFQIKQKPLDVFLCILLAGDIATNPGPMGYV
jgi:hypothetical protein